MIFAVIKIHGHFAEWSNMRTSKFRNLFWKNFRNKEFRACENSKTHILEESDKLTVITAF